ncbi:class I SAM-dependent rRNA methyltransferase [Priestia endophytica]|uniref:SAM-dependent methyltransferase n=1 Tax=Priestia endophytica DSM 13796 TaxID=1121089 RepID=A0A1I6BQG3_9BACI|nr:class I SAM-dependent rRNA methyltransferase [Priestia endophytica]KYG28631.1 50S rRNA methyltransferase [Priestia endophytica]MBG9811938.1 50S rRNA methyltransferase [Priestia endophytica]RAS82538.1 RlmI/RlmK family 23S rRNA methyltransferase [Priestia endophytica]SFQ83172.1 SAM-dependent methyltransferase [Priestia endophytica DSM 13796]
MSEMISLQIKRKDAGKIKNGFPLLRKEAIVNPHVLKKEGQLLRLVTESGEFLGTGYYGKQNKGYGWVLTTNEREKIDESFFINKLSQALAYRSSFFQNLSTTAFRVFNGEGDGIGGLTIEYFEGYYVINWYSEGIYAFKDLILSALKKVVQYKGLYEKKRFDQQGQYIEDDDFVDGERAQFPLIIKENDVNFATYLNDGAMVGIFLDQRNVRECIKEHYAKNKTVLNLFSYTGAFSVSAAVGGASKTTSVDVANRSLSKTIEQFNINQLDHEAHDIIVEDVFHYFKYAKRKEFTYDLVILDPPSFARSKKFRFSVAKDYQKLLEDTIDLTNDNGVIVASTNYSGFDMKKFKTFIDGAFKAKGERYKILEEYKLPKDFKTNPHFKEGNYLKVVFIQKA